MQNFRALGAPPPDPRAFGGWGFASKPPIQLPHCEFLAMRLDVTRKYPTLNSSESVA